jgi:gamma-glutamyltranspeptidase/glutathione hydrolase
MATGAAGGSHIITSTLQHLYHHLDQGLSAYDSTHQSRWHDQLGPTTLFEVPFHGLPGFNNGTVEYLRQRGYNISYLASPSSASHIIAVDKDGKFDVASDPRQAASGGTAF